MTEGKEQLSLIERQDAFLDQWAAAEGIPFASAQDKEAYQERAGLMAAAVKIDQTILEGVRADHARGCFCPHHAGRTFRPAGHV